MFFRLPWVVDMHDLESPDRQRVGDEGPMAPPGHGLGAHDGRDLFSGKDRQFAQGGGKFRGLHVIRETAKRRVSPALIGGIRMGAAQSPQGFHSAIGDTPVSQEAAQGFPIELRIVPRPRQGPNIDQALNAKGAKHPQELIQGPCGVPYRIQNKAAFHKNFLKIMSAGRSNTPFP